MTRRSHPEVNPEEVSAQVQALLEARAARVRDAVQRGDADTELVALAEFPVGDDHFAIALEDLLTVTPLRAVTAVPLAPPHVVGLVRYQERLVTVMSLASLVGVRGWRQDPLVLLFVRLTAQRVIAVDCEQVPRPTFAPRHLVDRARARAQGPLAELTTPDLRQVTLVELGRLLPGRGAAGGIRAS